MLFGEKINELLSKTNSSDNILEINKIVDETTYELNNILKIGKINLTINGEQNKNEICVFNSEFEYDKKNKFQDKLIVNNKYDIEITFYPLKNNSWQETEFEYATTYIKLLLNIYSNILLKNIISNAMITDGFTQILNLPGIINKYETHKDFYSKNIFTCAFISLKNFKYINQYLGMQGGNIILKKYADKLRELSSDKEEICGRMGGDNFFIAVKKSKFEKVLKELTDLEINYKTDELEKTFVINCKMGIADIMPGMHIMVGVEHSSIALAEAKRDVKNNYIYFNDDIFKQIMTRKKIKNDFPEALANKEFEVYFQPKVNSSTNKLYGAEALVRWNHGSVQISPADFISVLEEDDSICELDYYVLEQTCKLIKKWTDNNLEIVPISVNFAKNHLQNQDFSKKILNIINKYSVDPKYIEIELTESSAIYSKHALLDLIDTMKKNNIKVSLDDFGTGYSSLNLLKELNINTIKIDKSFVDNIEKEKDNIILGHVISMIKDLKMDVIAEGIETKKQLEYLQELGCFNVQGYLFDKPLKSTDFETKLKSKQY